MTVPVMLSADLVGKEGPPPKRLWTLSITNTGTAPATGVQIESLALAHVAGAGPMCDPEIKSPRQFPVQLGTIAPGATVQQTFELNVTNCSSNARPKVVAPVSAMSGAATTILVRESEPR